MSTLTRDIRAQIGNTAERVPRHVNCSVLAIKPDDLISPINLEE